MLLRTLNQEVIALKENIYAYSVMVEYVIYIHCLFFCQCVCIRADWASGRLCFKDFIGEVYGELNATQLNVEIDVCIFFVSRDKWKLSRLETFIPGVLQAWMSM